MNTKTQYTKILRGIQKPEKTIECFSYIKARLHSFDLWEQTKRSLQPLIFTDTNYKESPTPWFIGSNMKPQLPSLHHPHIYQSITVSLLSLSLSLSLSFHCRCLQQALETSINKLHLQTLGWNPSPFNP